MTVSADLDLIQARLHDDGTLWTRTELLRLYNDAYRQFLGQSQAVRRFRPTDLPGRHTFGVTQEWEDAYAARGTVRKPTRTALAGAYQGMSLWEIEAVEGITPTTSLDGHTQEWERAYLSGASDLHFRFSFPRNHERVVRLEWQNRKLHPIAVRELDDTDSRWFAQIGEPRWWTTGSGRVRSVELYEVASTYYQTYALLESDHGIARGFSGERTWAVETPIEAATAYAYTGPADVGMLSGLGSRVTRALALPLAYSEAVLADKPTAYYKLDETSGTDATDSSGNGHTATYMGSPTLGEAFIGSDVAARFDGSNDEVDVPSAVVDLLRGTLEFVIRPGFDSHDSDDWAIVSRNRVNVGGANLSFEKRNDNILRLTAHASSFESAEASTVTWRPRDLVHLAAAYHMSGALRIYVNGVLAASGTSTAGAFEAGGAVRIGRRAAAHGTDYFKGQIGHVAFYEGTLSQARIAAHAAALGGHASQTWYGTHAWELEWLDGETTFTDSTLIGTYTWEHQFGATALTLAVGQARSVSSTARQYLPVTSDATVGALLGRICDWRSSEDSVFALEVVTPDADLAETDTPTLLPAQLTKYLRYYVLSRAFGRPGEGRQPILAEFYGRRFQRGVNLFRAFGDVARQDRTYRREEAAPTDTRRPAYVRLPSTFPSVWR